MFPSWPDAAFFRILGGEPAMSILPNFLITGILTIILSLVFTIGVTMFIDRKEGSLVLIFLSISMLLLGGGIFPPIIGILIGILGTRINARLNWWRSHFSFDFRHFVGKLWPWSFAICITAWLLLLPGLSVIDYFFGVSNTEITYVFMLCAFVMLPVTVFVGFIKDAQQKTEFDQSV